MRHGGASTDNYVFQIAHNGIDKRDLLMYHCNGVALH